MSIILSDPLQVRPSAMQQVAPLDAAQLGIGGRIVRITDSSYTPTRDDSCLALTATTSTEGFYSITLGTDFPDGHFLHCVLPEEPGGADIFQLAGAIGVPLSFSTGGDTGLFRFLKTEGLWISVAVSIS